MSKSITYEVWLGDDLILSTENKSKASSKYEELPSGKNKAPSKRRKLFKVEVLKKD